MICCCCLLILLFVVVLRSKSIFFLFISLALPLSVCLRLCFVFLFSFHLFRVGLWFIRQVVVSDSKCYHNIFAFWILWCGSRLNRTALFFVSSNLLNNISSMRDEKKNHREEMGFDLGISFALSVSVSIGSQCIYRQSVNMFRLIYSFRSFRFWHRVNFITGNGLWNISVLLLAGDYRVSMCLCACEHGEWYLGGRIDHQHIASNMQNIYWYCHWNDVKWSIYWLWKNVDKILRS